MALAAIQAIVDLMAYQVIVALAVKLAHKELQVLAAIAEYQAIVAK